MRSTNPREAAFRLPSTFRLSVLTVAVAAAQGAFAQSPEPQQSQPEEIVITGSRIRLDGMNTPNPVTVVTPEQLKLTAPTTLIEGMAELPQFYQSNTTTNTGGFFTTPGAGSLNLRGLQNKRTLTLLGGRRVVPSTIYGGPDINLFPENILRTVETVTSGATATYGTDAVAGVVNFIVDTDFKGVKAEVQTGETDRGDNKNNKVSVSAGFAFGENGKTHFLVSGETFSQDAIWSRDGYDWYQGWGLVQNPSATRGQTPDNPINIAYPHVVSRLASLDGIVTLGTGTTRYSIDQNGNATPFVLGSAFDNSAQTIANGGSGTDNGIPEAQLQPETSRDNFFSYIEHNFNDNFKIYGQVLYGEASFTNKNTGGSMLPTVTAAANGTVSTNQGRGIVVRLSNPFLPAALRTAMIGTGTANAPQFATATLGRIGDRSDIAFDSFTQQDTETTSITAGFELALEGDGFFNDWQVNGYYQNGNTDVDAIQRGGVRIDRLYLAADAVTGPNGQPMCNVTVVSGLYPDCQPINLFGRGHASAAAVDWVTGFTPGRSVSVQGWLPGGAKIPYDYISTENKLRAIELDQDVYELTANGAIAKGWAGEIAMAVGIAYRDEGFIQYVQAPEGNPTTDPSARPVQYSDTGCPGAFPARTVPLGIRGVPCADATNSVEFQFSKVPFGIGDYNVKEAFTEFRIPLVADRAFAKRMDLDLAYRWAKYSGSDAVESWKGGFEWAITDRVRFRGTKSQDVRAATLGERYDRTGGIANVCDVGEDPACAAISRYDVTTVSGGNPTVAPEEAHTTTAGFVFNPGKNGYWDLSVDWYDINVKDNINLYGVQTIVDNCYKLGDVDSCGQIERNGTASTIKPGLNRISIVNDIYVNVNSVAANGIDTELAFSKPVNWFGGSNIGFRLLSSFLLENSRTNSAGLKTETQGTYFAGALPERQFTLSGNLLKGPMSVSLQARYQEETVQQNVNVFQSTFNGGAIRYDVADNTVDSSVLLDANFGYNFDLRGNTRMRLYFNINNLLDEDPQALYAVLGGLNGAPSNGYVGDLRGRRYALGLNVDF